MNAEAAPRGGSENTAGGRDVQPNGTADESPAVGIHSSRGVRVFQPMPPLSDDALDALRADIVLDVREGRRDRDRVQRAPETVAQATMWDRVKVNALRFGLCDRCAAQLAWAHQEGSGAVHPPCADCEVLVASLPRVMPNGWCTVTGSAAKPRSWPTARAADPSEPHMVRGPERELRRSSRVDERLREREG